MTDQLHVVFGRPARDRAARAHSNSTFQIRNRTALKGRWAEFVEMADRLTQLQEAVNQVRLDQACVFKVLSIKGHFIQQLGDYLCNSIGVLQQTETGEQSAQENGKLCGLT